MPKIIECNLCGIKKQSLLRIENSFKVVRCKKCGFVFMNPTFTIDEIKKFYNEYGKTSSDESAPPEHRIPVLKNELERLTKQKPDRGKLLDVGTAYGFAIKVSRDLGWDVLGIEPSKVMAKEGRKKFNLPIMVGMIEELNLPKNSFDAVTFFDVMEHIVDSKSVLKRVYELLKKDGIIAVRVPNFNFHFTKTKILELFGKKDFIAYDTPAHVNTFSPRTLKMFLEKSGFRNVKVEIGYPVYTKGRFKNFSKSIYYYFSLFLYKICRLNLGTIITVYGIKR